MKFLRRHRVTIGYLSFVMLSSLALSLSIQAAFGN